MRGRGFGGVFLSRGVVFTSDAVFALLTGLAAVSIFHTYLGSDDVAQIGREDYVRNLDVLLEYDRLGLAHQQNNLSSSWLESATPDNRVYSLNVGEYIIFNGSVTCYGSREYGGVAGGDFATAELLSTDGRGRYFLLSLREGLR